MKVEGNFAAMIQTFLGIDYLACGNPSQQAAFRVISELQLMERLKMYTPVLTGTVPIDVDIPGSDLDIICEVHDFTRYERDVRLVLEEAGISASFRAREVAGVPRIVCNFSYQGQEIELFGQPLPVTEQNAWRHMIVEARLLALLGETGRSVVRKLKQAGLKTEPAFACLLKLTGDPYEALLGMYDWNIPALKEAAREVTETNDKDGVALVLERITGASACKGDEINGTD